MLVFLRISMYNIGPVKYFSRLSTDSIFFLDSYSDFKVYDSVS